MTNTTPQPAPKKPVGDDMSISITDPPANQVVGGSFTVQGNYYCPVGGPTFQCSISPAPTGNRVSPVAAKTWRCT
jgi:hypothetical protein